MIKVNGRERDFVPNTTIAQLLEQMGYNLIRVAVECNGKIVPKKHLAETLTTDGDVLEVVSFVGGG